MKSIRALLIEDSEDDYLLTRKMLLKIKKVRFEVDWAASYQAGLEAIKHNSHHVYLLDYQLGAKNGLELLAEATAAGCKAPIILLTGTDDPEVDEAAMNAGAADYLEKSKIDPHMLERSIRYSLQQANSVQALQESEARLAAFMQNVPCAVFMKNIEGRYLYVNETWVRLLHRHPADWLGKTDQDLWQSPLAEKFKQIDQQVLASKRALETTDVISDEDGPHYWLTSRFPIVNPQGAPIMLGGAAVDITESKKAEERIRFQANALSQVNDAIVGVDSGQLITYWNRGAELLYGYKPHETLGLPLKKITQSRWVKPVDEKLSREALNSTGSWRGEMLHVKREGDEILVEASMSVLKENSGKVIGFLSIFRDITERKRLEKEILAISGREQSRLGQDLHDGLCQHLTGVACMLKGLEQKLASRSIPETVQAAEIAGLVNQAITQARDMARGLYPVELEVNGLQSALEELVTNVERQAGISCRLECEHTVNIRNNPVAIHLFRIAQEAVNNAVKHARARNIVINLAATNGKTTLTIRDDGIGIPEKFSKSKGMGLRLMKHRTEMINGTFAVGAGPEKGTTVTCSFQSQKHKPHHQQPLWRET